MKDLAYILYRIALSPKLLKILSGKRLDGKTSILLSKLTNFLIDTLFKAGNLSLYSSADEVKQDIEALEKLRALHVEGERVIIDDVNKLLKIWRGGKENHSGIFHKESFLIDFLENILLKIEEEA